MYVETREDQPVVSAENPVPGRKSPEENLQISDLNEMNPAVKL